MDIVKAKFECSHVTRHRNQETPVLSAVSATSEENKTWSQYTPSGRLELAITNPDAFDFFEPGAEYLLTIERVAK